MNGIRVVFMEVFDDKREPEEIIEFESADDPTHKIGDELCLVEAGFMDASDIKNVNSQARKSTHKIVVADSPVIVFTKNSETGEKVVVSKIYIYYLKKLEHKPGLEISQIAGMFH